MRGFWAIAGYAALGLGIVGIALPLLPTVPFMILAAFCFARSSKRMHRWLLNHPVFGEQIRNWEERGAINRRAKWLGSLSIAASFGVALFLGLAPVVLAVQAAILIAVTVFIWTRPVA